MIAPVPLARSSFNALLVIFLVAGSWQNTAISFEEKTFPLISQEGIPIGIEAPASPEFDTAVTELITHLEKITGKPFPVSRIEGNNGSAKKKGIILSLGKEPESQGGFQLKVTGDRITISSRSAEGVGFGVNELLEQLGVRWFMPGESGTVIPKIERPEIAIQSTTQSPSFESRHYQAVASKEWRRRVRLGGPAFEGAHGVRIGKENSFQERPELYALVNGRRDKRQLCISNPEVLRLAVSEARKYFDGKPEATFYGMGPDDGIGFCQCEGCKALDSGEWDPFSADPSVTDRYIWFFNRFLEELDKTHSGKKVAFYAYHTYMLPPRKVTPNPRIVPALAPIALCRIHGMNNPVCPNRAYYKGLMEAWTKLLPEVYERGYSFNLADIGLPFIAVSKMRDEIPQAKKYGIYGWRSESISNWASETPSLYIGAKLMWDVSADVDALMDDFCEKFFGPAKAPMKVYYETMDLALRDGDHHAGGSWDSCLLYTAAIRSKAAEALAKARALVNGEQLYRERVDLISRSFAYLQEFSGMIESRNRFEWGTAKEHLDRLKEIQATLTGANPPMLNPRSIPHYLARFFSAPVEEGYERSRGGNEIVATLPDRWDFLTDPLKLGEATGLQRVDLRGGNWQRATPYSTTWSTNSLYYYRGLAWYRQRVAIGEQWRGKRVFLWFGGVDETARVWVNGVQVGNSPRAVFLPFEMDVTHAVKPGEKNVVTVCVSNQQTDELGTGGIMAPVMFYSPVGGEKATPRNARPLRDTFP